MDPRFEAVCTDDDSSFRGLHFACTRLSDDHAWHYHPEYELTWVIRSEGTRFVGDSIQDYAAGDLVLVGPDLPHCWHNDAGYEGAQDPELIVIQFGKGAFGDGFLDLPEAAPVARLLAAAVSGLHFSGPVTNRVGELLRALMAQRGLVRTARLIEVLSVLAASTDVTPLATPEYHLNGDMNPVSRQRIERVHRYVRDNLDGDISQAEIASSLGLSSPAFSRFFKSVTGKTFVSFVNILRVDQACRMLQDPSINITEVAMSCGYHNISNFNRQFLAIKAMNPTDYRQRFRLKERRPTPTLKAAT